MPSITSPRAGRDVFAVFVFHDLVVQDDLGVGFARRPVIGRHVDDLGVAVLVDVPQLIRDHVLVKSIEFGRPVSG